MTEYRTASIPKPLTDDIAKFIEEVGYWPSLSSFVREACHEKLYVEYLKQNIIHREAEG